MYPDTKWLPHTTLHTKQHNKHYTAQAIDMYIVEAIKGM